MKIKCKCKSCTKDFELNLDGATDTCFACWWQRNFKTKIKHASKFSYFKRFTCFALFMLPISALIFKYAGLSAEIAFNLGLGSFPYLIEMVNWLEKKL